MALVSGAALAMAPIACAVGRTTRSTLRRRASSPDLSHHWQRAIGAGADHQPAASPRDVLVDRERGVPVRAAELPRGGLLPLADLPAVDDQVVIVGHAVDPDGTEGEAGESHADAPCPHRDRTAAIGGRSSFVVIRCLGDHRAASHSAMAGLWRVGCRARPGLSNRCGDLPLPGRPSAAWRSPRRPLAADHVGCNPAAPLRARSRSVRARQGPVQELNLHAVVALSGSLSSAAGRGGPRDRVAALAHLPGSGAAPLVVAQYRRLRQRARPEPRTCPPRSLLKS